MTSYLRIIVPLCNATAIANTSREEDVMAEFSTATHEVETVEERAASLVNPASGVANDYLNHFNEILLLIENLPVLLPEMMEDILNWRPITYREYFKISKLPGSASALATYDNLTPEFRHTFETMIERLNRIAIESIEAIHTHRGPDGDINPDDVTELCGRISGEMRKLLAETADLVNNGELPPSESPQHMVDRILDTVGAPHPSCG